MNVSTWLQPLHPRDVFRISRAARREAINVFLRIERDGITGYGEASPSTYYRETPHDVAARLNALGPFLAQAAISSPEDIAALWTQAWPLLHPSRAAQCALDLACWNWLAAARRVTLTELALSQKPRPVISFATIGLSDPEELRVKLEQIKGFPRVKVKVDGTGDLTPVLAVRTAMPDAMISVDANCAWGKLDLAPLKTEMEELRIEFIEQPFAPDDPRSPAFHPIPVMADESCVTEEDVPRLPAGFAGFNIKLVKCGGLTSALRMARRGRALGLRTMVGCMLESSLLISAGAVAAQLTDYADLDGAWLLSDDPMPGWIFDKGTLLPPK